VSRQIVQFNLVVPIVGDQTPSQNNNSTDELYYIHEISRRDMNI